MRDAEFAIGSKRLPLRPVEVLIPLVFSRMHERRVGERNKDRDKGKYEGLPGQKDEAQGPHEIAYFP